MKKYYFYLIAACLLIFSCKESSNAELIKTNPEGYIISGSAPGVFNGLRAYLKSTDEKGLLKNQDTAIIMNERFVFEGKVDSVDAWFLEINSLDSQFPFIIDNSSLNILVNKDNIKLSEIKGDKTNDAINDYNLHVKALKDSLRNTSEIYKQMTADKQSVAGMSTIVSEIKDAITKAPHEYIKENTDNLYSLVLIKTMVRRNAKDKGLILESYDALDNDLKASNIGKRVAKSIPDLRKQYAIIASTHIGKVAPNFSAPNPHGKLIQLNDIKGKATLVHFWSSWFKASRRENAKLVKLYDLYHDKGLEMIGVSLDGSESQTNPKSDWKKAIKDDQLIWNQISNLNYFSDSISKAYSVKSLPTSFLLDSNGVIVAKNLRGNSLDAKLRELLD